MVFGNSATANEISIANSAAKIVWPTNSSRWIQTNSGRFRYYASGYGAVQLYKKNAPSVAYTVTYGDAIGGSVKEASAGAGVTLATRVAPVGSFYTFEGWSETNLTVETTSATIIKTDATYYPSKDVTLYPVYSRTVAASAMPNASVTISEYAEAHSWSDATQYTSVTINSQLTASASGGANDGKYYNGNQWRFYQSSSGKISINVSEGYSLSSVTFTYTVSSNGVLKYNTKTMSSGTAQSVTGTSAQFTVSATSGSSGQVRITAIEVAYKKDAVTYYTSLPDEEESKTVTEFGWATYIPAHAVEFGDGCAFVVTDASTTIKLTGVTKVPVGTPVILKKAAGGDIDATVINESPADPATNLLSIGGATIPDGKEAWVLAKNGVGNACFKLWKGTASVLEGRVVLFLDEGGSARNFIDFEDEEATGIAVAKTQTTNNAEYYDLQGRRIVQPTKGLYIVNGKKVVIK